MTTSEKRVSFSISETTYQDLIIFAEEKKIPIEEAIGQIITDFFTKNNHTQSYLQQEDEQEIDDEPDEILSDFLLCDEEIVAEDIDNDRDEADEVLPWFKNNF